MTTTTVPRCDYCRRRYSDKRGCEYVDGDERPVPYGSEVHPVSTGPTCRDCSAPKGTDHHVYCLCTECEACHRQFHPGLTCAEDAALTTGATA